MDITVAQAVARATQEQQQQQQAATAEQAQHLINQPSPPVQPVQNASSTIDNLTCQWQGCGERCDSAEALYVSTSLLSVWKITKSVANINYRTMYASVTSDARAPTTST